MPLFPLGLVLYPVVMLPLHIFEERYRRLVRDLLDMQDGSRLFGIIWIKAGRDAGTDGIIALHDIVVTGMQRFWLLEVEDAEPMLAVIDVLPDPQSARSAAMAARVGRLFL